MTSGVSSYYGSAATFTATLSGSHSAVGSIKFIDIVNGAEVVLSGEAGAALVATDATTRTATFTIDNLEVGSHSIVARYEGDVNNAASNNSPTQAHTVDKVTIIIMQQITTHHT